MNFLCSNRKMLAKPAFVPTDEYCARLPTWQKANRISIATPADPPQYWPEHVRDKPRGRTRHDCLDAVPWQPSIGESAGRSLSTWISRCGGRRAADGGPGHMRSRLAALSRRLPVAMTCLRCSSLFSSSKPIPQCGQSCPDEVPSLPTWLGQ